MPNHNRRDFIKKVSLSAAVASALPIRASAAFKASGAAVVVDGFDRLDSLYHGDGWESMNPGYWQIKGGALRRKLHNRGDQRPGHWFPWHYETHTDEAMPTRPDPSLPFGMIWRRDWKLSGNYTLSADLTVRALPEQTPQGEGRLSGSAWQHDQPGYAVMGLAFGGQCLHESWEGGGEPGNAARMALWRDDNRFGLYDHAADAPNPAQPGSEATAPELQPGSRVTITLDVRGDDPETADVRATLASGGGEVTVEESDVDRAAFTDGYLGLVARGLLDFEVNEIRLEPGENQPLDAPQNRLHVAYALGDTLRQEEDVWRCRFVAMFRGGEGQAEIRIADTPEPESGWQSVPVAGRAEIITNDFRRSTAVIDAALPASPAETALYYTVWQNGEDVTADPRLGTASVGPGTGFLGEVPASGGYVGRLPQLTAPYRLCGLSCHAIAGNRPNLPDAKKFQAWYVHDQPTPEALQHLEAFDYQVMMWEDDVWYLELVFPPPSTDDAYKVITTTLGGPATRWQMMRHWNVINPGDHDYGMDDVKGPEQLIIRTTDGLGQDAEYMRRNFQIVAHLTRAEEEPSATVNPERWRRWRMPDGDFALLILDARLWRSSQDTNIWDDEGWGHRESLYARQDPTRSLLGEAQFAWLQQTIRTDPAPLIGVTGVNGLHTVWTGTYWGEEADPSTLRPRDRVAADYAGWVSAGADRILDVLGSRPGVVTVYGDVHNGCIMKNQQHRVFEACFGPIGRTGGRALKTGFGPQMTDYEGRELEVIALYHEKFADPTQTPNDGPVYWNVLEMHFDPRGTDPEIALRIRNMIDAPADAPRGGGVVETTAAATGRPFTAKLPRLTTLPGADVLFTTTDGAPLRGARALPDGTVPIGGLVGVAPGSKVIVTAHRGEEADVEVVELLSAG